jgi:ribosome maturation factor RimP
MESKYSGIISDFLKNSRFVLIDFIQRGDERNIILEVYVDRKENFSIDELAEINKNLWKYIEDKKVEKGIAKVTVSSPGAERAFKYFWQMEKHIGRELEIKMKNGEAITGKLLRIVDEEKGEFEIEIKDKKENINKNINFGDLSEVKIKLSFKK